MADYESQSDRYKGWVSEEEHKILEAKQEKEQLSLSTAKLVEFQTELATLINRYSIENLLDTPDFIIAENMVNHLIATANIVARRDKWYSFDPWGDK